MNECRMQNDEGRTKHGHLVRLAPKAQWL